ncbi:hypothetical protein FA13DRAFT_1726173 [Coprinellus micaceus]|uniref:C2H2-type domain-containing protein n=1 Tax=Coprinellus micaceus TaxID=71717 RepID=A0A4Y7TWF5_COPMI|nr:hypothetical protein FA13DRAFT_1726173 [Coprinellus micaceus]
MDGTQQASTTTDSSNPQPPPPRDDDWNSDSDSEDDEDNDSDIDAEAEEIARRLGEQLWALNNVSAPAPEPTPVLSETQPAATKGQEAALETIRAILTILENDPPAKALLEATPLPGLAHNVLGVLQQSANTKSVAKSVMTPLSQVLVELARCEQLFADLRLSNAPAIQLDRGKRKRDELEDHDARLAKRPYIPEEDMQTQVMQACRNISQALSTAPSATLDPVLVSSIQIPLHQVFLFAVTSSARVGPAMHALQEISGLIQVIGVLSGIQIGQNPHPFQPWAPTDIGTAVYPCQITGCCKIFSRLFSLRAHQRNHAVHRPYRCTICPASFARNHDLKRHIRLHDRKAWKCAACQKSFSRRDAFKRHKDGSRARGFRSEHCATAEVIEVELDEEDGNDISREERRAKLWTGLANSHASGIIHTHRDNLVMEEGEIPENLIQITQASVLGLHGLLQAHVGNVLGVPTFHEGQPQPPIVDAVGSQATLASVIARAQSQAMPAPSPPELVVGDQGPTMDTSISQQEGDAAQNVGQPISEDLAASASNLTPTPLSMYGLSDEQTKLLEVAIANAASLAQAQAEAEAALEEEDEDDSDQDDGEDDEGEGQPIGTQNPVAV